MKALAYDPAADRFSVAEQPTPSPGPHDVLVRVHACGLVELVRVVRPESNQDAFMKGLGFHQLSLGSGHRHGERARATLVAAGRQVSVLLESGVIQVPRLAPIPLAAVGDALKEMRAQRIVGKVVMSW